MGLMEQEIKELRQMQKKVLGGEMTVEQVSIQIAISNQIAKRETLMYNMLALSAKFGAKALKPAVAMNLIGSGAIDVECGEEEVVVCCERGGTCISRNDCLDYSGESRHIDACQKCDQFAITRKQLAPS